MTPKLAREWWAKASRVSEEEYVCAHVFPARKKTVGYDWVNSYCLWIVAHRYPQYLGEIYERLLRERPDLYSGMIPETISTCQGLTREEKLRLLQLGAQSPNLDRRREAIGALVGLDPVDANARILAELARLPDGASPARESYSAEQDIGRLVQKSDSPEVWQAFERTARRVGPDLRAKWLWCIRADSAASPARRALSITFLSAFLDDASLRGDDEFDGGPSREAKAAHQPPPANHIVGNQAAQSLGDILGVKGYPNEYSDTEEWAKYRAAVLAALDKE